MNDQIRQYQFLFDNMTHGAFFQDADGTLTDVNQAALDMFGLSRDQFLGRTSHHPEWHVIDVNGSPLPPEKHPSMISLQSGKHVRDFIAGVYHPHLQEFVWLEINSTPMFRQGEAKPYRVVTTIHDITTQRLAEDSLKRSDLLFRQFFDLPLMGTAITTPAKGWLAINDRLCTILGYTKDELMNIAWTDLTHPDDLAADLAQFNRVISGEIDGYTLEKRFIRKDGRIIWASIAGQCIRKPDGEVDYFAALLHDITEQKLATLALKQSEEKYRQLHETMIDGFAMVDMDGTIRDWNESFRMLLGYLPDELARLTYRDITPEKWHATEARIVREEVMQRGYSQVYEKEYIRKDGTVVPVELSTCLMRDHLANPSGMWATVRDISDRKAMEKALRDSEERYRRFIATANEGIGISNSSYIITYVNRCLATMLGYDENELIGRHVSSLLPPDELCSFSTTMSERHQGLSGQRECRHRRKDGSVIWLLTSSTPILDDAGAFQGCFAMFTDLTDLKNAEIVLQRTNEELEARVAERTSALARANDQILKISFELVRAQEQERSRIAAELHDQVGQTLLLAKMKLDMLASKTGSPVESNYIENVVTLLESTIHDIRTLTFSMRPPLLETAGLEAALEWLCTSIENDYNLQIEFCRICRPLSLAGEQRYSLFQAVRELLLNVAKHAGVDSAKLSLYSEDSSLIVRVSDEGTGFAGKGKSPLSESNGGFGLFNVQQRIELLGGSIAIATSPGKGTAVTLTVPLDNQRREREPWN